MKQCIEPGSIEDWELDAFADGIHTDRVSRHLEHCDFCDNRLRQLRQLNNVLSTALYRLDCPSVDEIRALRWNQLSRTRAASVRQHLATCAACAHEAAAYDGQASDTSEKSSGWLEQAISVLVARLSPLTLAPRPALRGSAVKDIIYEVEETGWEIALTAVAETTGYSLAGQVLGPDPADFDLARVTLLADNRLVREAGLDPTGWFELRGLAAGDFVLWLEFSATRVEMPELHLGTSILSDD